VSLYESPVAASAGVNMLYGASLFKQPEPQDPSWAPITYAFRRLDSHDLGFYQNKFVDGYMYQTPLCEGRLYITWLTQRIKALGGKLVQQKLFALDDVLEQGSGRGARQQWDLVVNCCGLGSSTLLEDADVYPIRGQVIRVKAPWISHAVFADPFYIIPNRDYVVLGGTAQYDDWNLNVSLEDRERILFHCCQIFPSLAGAEVVGDWVGLRPGRKTVRLDAGLLERPNGQGLCPVIHNYGHGGAGLTLGWGCAEDVVYMAQLLLS
jgi:glycine/D-amino acid oxidase-like deaminating enzyme